jgi:hypothetical protein
MGVSNHVYFDKNAKQKNTQSHGLDGIKDPLADRGKVDIFENFIQAVRNRKEEHLDAHVYEGHVSSGLCHLANLSYRLGEKSGFSKKKKSFSGNKNAYEYIERMQEHLKENGLKLEEADYIVGRTLNFDSKSESIIGDDEANKMLSRTYRPPYVVPDRV